MPALKVFHPDASVAGGITVAQIVELYLAYLAGRVLLGSFDDENLRNISRELKAFAEAFDQDVGECRQRDLSRWLAAMCHVAER